MSYQWLFSSRSLLHLLPIDISFLHRRPQASSRRLLRASKMECTRLFQGGCIVSTVMSAGCLSHQ
ncbi:hypothetical protein I7I48_11407 [Histoplasma ohiense]|nr:hypothetical protein I7I48_11407 [Histoplasma ohiense (nom. inval.)]